MQDTRGLFCVECGTEAKAKDAVFCENCGSKLQKAPGQTAPIQTTPGQTALTQTTPGQKVPIQTTPIHTPASSESSYNTPTDSTYSYNSPTDFATQQNPPNRSDHKHHQKRIGQKKPFVIASVIIIVLIVLLGAGIYFVLLSDPADDIRDDRENPSTENPNIENPQNPAVEEDREESDINEPADSTADSTTNSTANEDETFTINIFYNGSRITEFELNIFERAALNVDIGSAESGNEIIWENSNPDVLDISVNNNGHAAMIRGVGPGKTTITLIAGSSVQTFETTVTRPQLSKREYIIPNSNTQRLTEASIEHLSNAELVIAWNEIYARHGFMFGSKALSEWFDMQPWYIPIYPYGTFNYGHLSAIERSNVTTLRGLRDRRNEGRAHYQGTGADDIAFYQTFWDSSSRYIFSHELEDMGTGLETALHEIYARHGRIFTNPRWSEYYKSFTWYEPRIPDHEWDDSILNAFEQVNVELLRFHISMNPNLESNPN